MEKISKKAKITKNVYYDVWSDEPDDFIFVNNVRKDIRITAFLNETQGKIVSSSHFMVNNRCVRSWIIKVKETE